MSINHGHLRLVPSEPQLAVAAGNGGSSGSGGLAGWTIVDHAVTRIDGEVRTFEIAGWRTGNHVADERTPIEVTPDWLCEAAEPDRAAQLARYVGRGIGHVWLLDQASRTIEAYRLDHAGWKRVAIATAGARLRAEPFEDIELELSSLWES
jgi:hypothetical protein